MQSTQFTVYSSGGMSKPSLIGWSFNHTFITFPSHFWTYVLVLALLYWLMKFVGGFLFVCFCMMCLSDMSLSMLFAFRLENLLQSTEWFINVWYIQPNCVPRFQFLINTPLVLFRKREGNNVGIFETLIYCLVYLPTYGYNLPSIKLQGYCVVKNSAGLAAGIFQKEMFKEISKAFECYKWFLATMCLIDVASPESHQLKPFKFGDSWPLKYCIYCIVFIVFSCSCDVQLRQGATMLVWWWPLFWEVQCLSIP